MPTQNEQVHMHMHEGLVTETSIPKANHVTVKGLWTITCALCVNIMELLLQDVNYVVDVTVITDCNFA